MPEHASAAGAAVCEPRAYDPAVVVRHIAHQLRQPLGAIESIAHYLTLVLPRTEARARGQLVRLEEEIRHAQWVLTDALHLLGATPVNPHLLDLTEIVSKALASFADSPGATLSFSLDPELPLVMLDVAHAEHLLHNVLSVFRRITSPLGTISVLTYAKGGEVFLEIGSRSLEFAPGNVEALFSPFDSPLPEGTGLALASAQRITEMHGGRIEAVSESPESLFVTVIFPPAPCA